MLSEVPLTWKSLDRLFLGKCLSLLFFLLGRYDHLAAKVVKRHFPGRLKLRCVRPLMLKYAVSESISPPHAQLYGVRRWGSGPVLEGVWGEFGLC